MAKQVEGLAHPCHINCAVDAKDRDGSSVGEVDGDASIQHAYQRGDVAKVFSSTAGGWMEGRITDPVLNRCITVEFQNPACARSRFRKHVQPTSKKLCLRGSNSDSGSSLSGSHEIFSLLDALRKNGQAEEARRLLVESVKKPGKFQELLDGLTDESEAVREVVVQLISDTAVFVEDTVMMEKATCALEKMLAKEGRSIREGVLDAIAQLAGSSKSNELMERALLTLVKTVKQDRHPWVQEKALRAIPPAIANSTDNVVIQAALITIEIMSRQSSCQNVREVAAFMLAELAIRATSTKWMKSAGDTFDMLLNENKDFFKSLAKNEMVLDAIAQLAFESNGDAVKKALSTLEALYRKALVLNCPDCPADTVLIRIPKVAMDSGTSELIRKAFLMLDEKINVPKNCAPTVWMKDLVKMAVLSTDIELKEKASLTVNNMFVDPRSEFQVKAIAQAAVNSGCKHMMKQAFLILMKTTSDKKSSMRQASVRAIAAVVVNSGDNEVMEQAVFTLQEMMKAKDQTKTTKALVRNAIALLNGKPFDARYCGSIPKSIF